VEIGITINVYRYKVIVSRHIASVTRLSVNKVISTHAVSVPEAHTRQSWPRIPPGTTRSPAVARINTGNKGSLINKRARIVANTTVYIFVNKRSFARVAYDQVRRYS